MTGIARSTKDSTYLRIAITADGDPTAQTHKHLESQMRKMKKSIEQIIDAYLGNLKPSKNRKHLEMNSRWSAIALVRNQDLAILTRLKP